METTQPEPAEMADRTQALAAASVAMMGQAADLLGRLPPDVYQTPSADHGGSTVGQHVRHCLDHFTGLVRGIRTGRVDYDDRQRNVGVELDPNAARAAATALMEQLQNDLAHIPADHPLLVTQACSVAGPLHPEASSVGRELQFLVSHTVHHFAMIAAICRQHGVGLPTEFGVAHSTLRFRAGP